MKFYRRLTPIKAISFDLDDTLYSNRGVMLAIEKQMINYFADKLSSFAQHTLLAEQGEFTRHFWFQFRQQAIVEQPDLRHDVVVIRLHAYILGMQALGMSEQQAHEQAQAALAYFIQLRSDFEVPSSSIALLKKLSEKYPLVAISNGNVDTKALGISQYFQAIYHAGYQQNHHKEDQKSDTLPYSQQTLLKQKPATDMFVLACKNLDILPEQLLHVGDCGRADIQGALNAGCQAAWLSCYDVGKPIVNLPHIELAQVTELECFLP